MTTHLDIVDLLRNSTRFLNQNDLLNLALTSKTIHDEVAIDALYQTIYITKEPVLRSSEWFLETGTTYLSGYRALKKSNDQNDLFLFDRIERLLQSKHLPKIKKLIVDRDVFSDAESGLPLLDKFIKKMVKLDYLSDLDIREPLLFEENYTEYLKMSNLTRVKIASSESLAYVGSLRTLQSLEWFVLEPDFFNVKNLEGPIAQYLSNNLVELNIRDTENSSLRVIDYLHNMGVRFRNLQSLKFNHSHSSHDYSFAESNFFETIDPSKLKKLEISIACEEKNCSCMDDFFSELASRLENLHHLGLIENTQKTQYDHYTAEDWDIAISKFILKIPNVSRQLFTLCIRHNTPINGLILNNMDGNYTRRRKIYEAVLPNLRALNSLIAPTMLQSISSYEIYVSDLLWNGCVCEYCKEWLPRFDDYFMNHQYYSKEDGEYKDLVPTVFFAYVGDAIAKRYFTHLNWDLDGTHLAPSGCVWNLHGYENLHHFDNFKCDFDESYFGPLAIVVKHFFDGYMAFMVPNMPSLKTAIFSGIYYSINRETRTFTSIYD